MKKIINKKLYNTETAKDLGFWNNGRSCCDSSYMEETLYQKKTGEFFLYGYGGALTGYAKRVGTSQSEGEKITPLSVDEAKEWAEEHLDADDYLDIFEDTEE